MKWLRAACQSRWLWTLSLFLTGLGARLWLIHRFGTPLPFWDQWEEARVVYLPFFAGKLTLADLLSAHNEHRIFCSRLYGLALTLLNRQWDGQLEMVGDAVLHCATLAGLGWLMFRRLDRSSWMLLWLPLVLVLVLPFGWENSLAGFQSVFYIFLLLSLLTLWLLGAGAPGSASWWLGALTAITVLLTLASGFLAAVAVFGLAVLRIWRRPSVWRQQLPTLCVCAAVAVAGVLLRVDVRHHHVLQAHSASEFLAALGANLAWPWIVVPPFALLNVLPLLLLGWRYLKRSEGAWPAAELTLAIGLWTVLQGAAAAYARGADGRPPGWRYMDSSSFILIAGCFSIAVLLSGRKSATNVLGRYLTASRRLPFSGSRAVAWLANHARPLAFGALILWGLACATGLVLLTARAWQIDIPERQLLYRAQLKLVRAFMATDNPGVFDHKPKSYLISYQGDPLAPPLRYEAEWTVEYLRNPIVRNILPACARAPLEVRADPTATHGFVTNGFRLARRELPTGVSWGSYTMDGVITKGRFESAPISKSKLPFLEFEVAGDLGKPGLTLALVELSSGKTIAAKPRQAPGDRWQSCRVRAPQGDFRIIASDESDGGWFAFQPPRELGWLSWAAERLAAVGGVLFFSGLGICLVGLVCVYASLMADRRPGEASEREAPD